MPLFVVLRQGGSSTPALAVRLKKRIRDDCHRVTFRTT